MATGLVPPPIGALMMLSLPLSAQYAFVPSDAMAHGLDCPVPSVTG
jgi:hypothetical protein